MTRALDIRTARRRYVTVCVLFWLPLGLTIAPLILLFTERGMTMAAIRASSPRTPSPPQRWNCPPEDCPTSWDAALSWPPPAC